MFFEPENKSGNHMTDLNVKRNSSRVGLGLLFFILTSEILLPAVIRLIAKALEVKIPTGPIAVLIRGTFPMYLIAIPLTWLLLRRMPVLQPHHRSPAPLWFLILIPITLFIMTAGGIIGDGLANILSDILRVNIQNTTVNAVSRAPIWAQILLVMLIGPFFEELLFRKLLMDRLMVYSSRNAILLSALTFALFHTSIHQFFYAFGVGIILAGLYQNTGRLVFPWALHAIANFMGGILQSFVPGRFMGILGIVYLIISSLGLVLMIYHRKMLLPKDEPQDLPGSTTSPAMILNPGMLLYIIVTTLFTILLFFT